LATRESPDVAFHYVSGTPYSLDPSIDRFFVNASYPLGVVTLAKLRFKNPTTVLGLLQYAQFKVVEANRVAAAYPQRRIVLFGDSGQSDAKAYGELMRGDPNGARYPCAFIRLVTGIDAKKEAKLNQRSVFDKAFAGVPTSRWYLYRDPAELWNIQWEQGRCRPANVPDSVVMLST